MHYMTLADVTDEQRIAFFVAIFLMCVSANLLVFRKVAIDLLLSMLTMLSILFFLLALVVLIMAGITSEIYLSIMAGTTMQAYNFAKNVAIPFLNSTVYPVVQKVFEEYAKR